jgi:hypothetical protein
MTFLFTVKEKLVVFAYDAEHDIFAVFYIKLSSAAV